MGRGLFFVILTKRGVLLAGLHGIAAHISLAFAVRKMQGAVLTDTAVRKGMENGDA